jgi:hypothetical protein
MLTVVAQEGSAALKVGMPEPSTTSADWEGLKVAEVIIAVDPAKRSHTLEVLDAKERVLARLRVDNTAAGYRELRQFARRWPTRRWAVEGARGSNQVGDMGV